MFHAESSLGHTPSGALPCHCTYRAESCFGVRAVQFAKIVPVSHQTARREMSTLAVSVMGKAGSVYIALRN
jgi:hypothetical protein